MRRLAVLAALCMSLSTSAACTSLEGQPASKREPDHTKIEEPQPDPDPDPASRPIARASIASVQLIEDCPDDEKGQRPPPTVPDDAATAPAAAQPPAAEELATPKKAARMAPGARARPMGDVAPGHEWKQPCTQSTMQVVFSGQGDVTTTVEIDAVRLLDPKSGKPVARLEAREPAAWRDGAYQSWDQTIGPHQEVKASYELSVPNWREVETAMGTASYGVMFLLEVDVKVDDEVHTVRSREFPRERPHVVVT